MSACVPSGTRQIQENHSVGVVQIFPTLDVELLWDELLSLLVGRVRSFPQKQAVIHTQRQNHPQLTSSLVFCQNRTITPQLRHGRMSSQPAASSQIRHGRYFRETAGALQNPATTAVGVFWDFWQQQQPIAIGIPGRRAASKCLT